MTCSMGLPSWGQGLVRMTHGGERRESAVQENGLNDAYLRMLTDRGASTAPMTLQNHNDAGMSRVVVLCGGMWRFGIVED